MAVLTYAQAPRVLMIVLVFVSIFLLSFVMVGCMHAASSFSNIFAVQFQYNDKSPFYSYIKQYFNGTHGSTIEVKTGLMGICTSVSDNTLCTSMNYKPLNESQLLPIADFSIFAGTSSNNKELGSLNLLDLALSYSGKDKYGMLMGVLICLGVSLTSLLFVAFFPVSPENWRNWSGYLFLLIALVFSLVANLTMHTASHTTKTTVERASLGLVSVQVGRRASAMYWTAFGFITIAVALIWPTNARLKDQVFLEKEHSKLRV